MITGFLRMASSYLGYATFSWWLLVALGTSLKQNHAYKSSASSENLTNGSKILELVNNKSSFSQEWSKIKPSILFPNIS